MEQLSVCRCCSLSFSYHRELFTEYSEGGFKEVYSEMLTETFSVTISHQNENTICENCVKRLKEASEFKQLVLLTETALIKQLSCLETDVDKKNLLHDEKVLESSSQNISSDTFNCENIKTKIEMDFFEETFKNDSWYSDEDVKPIKAIDKSKNRSSIENSKRDNTLKLINYSNMCPFVSKVNKFKCFYCKTSFNKMVDLREHSQRHDSTNARLKLVFSNLHESSTRTVDITSLMCKICSKNCNNLDDLQEHLEDKHDIEFESNDHFLVPYRLNGEYSCVACSKNFNTFHTLNVHMNSHYFGNVCEYCGVSFSNRQKLNSHIYSLHRPQKCTLCNESFKSGFQKAKHMRERHKLGFHKRICPDCGENFKYAYLLTNHRIKQHNLETKKLKCKECDKEFGLSCNLSKHIRNVHRGEKRFSCEICDMNFYSSTDRKRHLKCHEDNSNDSGKKQHSCIYCQCKFKRKDSWQRHLRQKHAVHE